MPVLNSPPPVDMGNCLKEFLKPKHTEEVQVSVKIEEDASSLEYEVEDESEEQDKYFSTPSTTESNKSYATTGLDYKDELEGEYCFNCGS